MDGSDFTAWAVTHPTDLTPLERRVLDELGRLECDWGLDAAPSNQFAPRIPINVNSLGAYVRGFQRARDLSKRIAETVAEPFLDDKEVGYESYVEMARGLGFETIAAIDDAMVIDRELIVRIAAYFIPQSGIRQDFALYCMFMVRCGKMGSEAHYSMMKDLRLWSASKAFSRELQEIYELITAY